MQSSGLFFVYFVVETLLVLSSRTMTTETILLYRDTAGLYHETTPRDSRILSHRYYAYRPSTTQGSVLWDDANVVLYISTSTVFIFYLYLYNVLSSNNLQVYGKRRRLRRTIRCVFGLITEVCPR